MPYFGKETFLSPLNGGALGSLAQGVVTGSFVPPTEFVPANRAEFEKDVYYGSVSLGIAEEYVVANTLPDVVAKSVAPVEVTVSEPEKKIITPAGNFVDDMVALASLDEDETWLPGDMEVLESSAVGEEILYDEGDIKESGVQGLALALVTALGALMTNQAVRSVIGAVGLSLFGSYLGGEERAMYIGKRLVGVFESQDALKSAARGFGNKRISLRPAGTQTGRVEVIV